MRTHAPFRQDDLADLDARLFSHAAAVVPMEEVADGLSDPLVIGLRHDCDNEINSSVLMAAWEAERGVRATYFVLHTTDYWNDEYLLRSSLEAIVAMGHTLGVHNDAVSEAIVKGADPHQVLSDVVGRLRGYGFDIVGTVAHGSHLCYEDGVVRYVNDEVFKDCSRPKMGDPDRTVAGVTLGQSRLEDFGFEYDSNQLSRAMYLSDSNGRWNPSFDEVADGFPFSGQLHVLIHPCHWARAFSRERVAA